MRLLNIHTFELEQFFDANKPPYVIASHRWFKEEEEPTLQDMKKGRKMHSKGYKKIRDFCFLIQRLNLRNAEGIPLEWLWIDTCCIDKKNWVDLSESIASMFLWYRDAHCCLTLLSDVLQSNDHRMSQDLTLATSKDSNVKKSPSTLRHQLEKSQWFRRGWTLQELVAPRTVIFLDREWNVLGHKGHVDHSMASFARLNLTQIVHEITGVPEAVLNDYRRIEDFPVGERLRWMEGRVTTRSEDRAYGMMGICDVRIPLLYGEPVTEAMNRLLLAVHEKGRTIESELLREQRQEEKLRELDRAINLLIRERQEAQKTHRHAKEKQRLEDTLWEVTHQEMDRRTGDENEPKQPVAIKHCKRDDPIHSEREDNPSDLNHKTASERSTSQTSVPGYSSDLLHPTLSPSLEESYAHNWYGFPVRTDAQRRLIQPQNDFSIN